MNCSNHRSCNDLHCIVGILKLTSKQFCSRAHFKLESQVISDFDDRLGCLPSFDFEYYLRTHTDCSVM